MSKSFSYSWRLSSLLRDLLFLDCTYRVSQERKRKKALLRIILKSTHGLTSTFQGYESSVIGGNKLTEWSLTDDESKIGLEALEKMSKLKVF